MQKIQVIDSHTGGEPTRVITGGGPDLGTGSMQERLAAFRAEYDWLRSATVNEPRGSDVLVGALLCPPVDPSAAAGVIFFNNVGYLGMCGHGTIGLVETLRFMGRIGPGRHRIETPVGEVTAELDSAGTVTLQNVASYRYRRAVTVNVEGLGPVTGDVAYGGNWFFLVNHASPLLLTDVEHLTELTWRIRQSLTANGITGKNGAEIDHVELFHPSPTGPGSRNFVLCPGKAYDRSPCGTGTSAKLACLAADGKLEPGQRWRQESIVGSEFFGSYALTGQEEEAGPVVAPTISGTAYVTSEATLLLDPADPFRWGLRV